MAYSTTDLNNIVKETFDAVIQKSYENNTNTLKMFKREAATESITGRGRVFAIKIQDNESYGSMTSEGGAFPLSVDSVDVQATVNYRSQFATFDFTGDVEDLRSSKTLRDALSRIIEDTTSAFDEKQNFFLFGTGTGAIAVASGSNTAGAQTFLTSVTNPQGARFVRKGQLLSIMDSSSAFADLGDHTVSSVARSTDVVTFGETVASDVSDILTFRDSYNFAPHGIPFHVNNADSSWLGLSRVTYPQLGSIVHDAASASIDWDMVELALLKSRNVRGDMAPKFDYMLCGHPVQHKNLRALARSSGNVQYNANLGGNKNIDLSVQDVSIAGMKLQEDSWCPPSDVYGLRMSDWNIDEVVPRQLYKHNNGDIFLQQINTSSNVYNDAKEGRVYARYDLVCKRPSNQFRIKNINFDVTEVVIQRT